MPTIKIDGVDYPLMGDDIDLDEAGWFYDIAGVGPEVLDSLGSDFKPKVTKALICLTVARAKPDTPHKEIEDRIGKMKLTELEKVFEGLVDDSPPAQDPGSEGEPQSSGAPSNDASAGSLGEDGQPLTGAQPSDTGAASDPETSASLRRVS